MSSSSASSNTIKKLAIRGTIWTVASYGAGQILRFGSNLILTRLLVPELFGLMSLVYVFISGLHLFSDLGISTNVIQNKRGDEPDFLNTAWTLQVIRGLALWGGCLLLAWPASHFYNEPRLLWLVPLVGLNTVISGFNSTSLFTLNRHLSVKQLALFEIGGQVASIGIMLIWAYFNRSIWAIVIGGFASSLFQLVWSHRMNPGKPNHFAWDKKAIRELILFGRWIFFSTALVFLSTQADRLILGRLFSFELLGVYGVAFTLSDIPRQVIMAVSGKVIFPAYSKLSQLPRTEFVTKISRSRGLVLIVLSLGLAVLVSFGDLLVTVLYDSRYAEASWMMPILALGTWPIMLTQTVDPVLLAIGQPRYIALGGFYSFLCYAIGIPVGFHFFKEFGAVFSVAVSNVPFWAAVIYGLWREQLSLIRQDIIMTGLFLGVLALLLWGRAAVGLGFPLDGLWR